MSVNWDVIRQTQSYQDDQEKLLDLLVKSFGINDVLNEDSLLVLGLVDLLALHRYDIKHIPEQVDLDESQYLPLIQKQVGFDIPLTSAVPIVEFLRENKHWHGNKGRELLYDFIGCLVNSPVNLYYPMDLIFTLDSLGSALDGDVSDTGPLPFNDSKMAFLRDGIYWANYTYIVQVAQAQNVPNFADLFALVNSLHPAGTRMFLEMLTWSVVTRDYESEGLRVGHWTDNFTYFFNARPYISLDNNFYLDDLDSMLDQLNGFNWTGTTWIQTSRKDAFFLAHRNISHDSYMHSFPEGHPDQCFYKLVPTTNDLYKKIYPDEDAEILSIQQTNMSFKDLTMGDILDRPMRELNNIAWDMAGNNPPKKFYREVPLCTIVETTP